MLRLGAAAEGEEDGGGAVAYAQFAVCPPAPEYSAVQGENKRAAEVALHRPKGEGDGNEAVRQLKRARTVEAKAKRGALKAEELTEARVEAGLLCCRAECPETKRKCEFTTQQKARYDAHVSGRVGHHTWVQSAGHGGSGVNAMDVIVRLAAAPGGSLAAGTNPDRMGSMAVEPTPVTVLTAGAAAACCAGKFLKPEPTKPYKKPPRLKKELEQLYAVGLSDDASGKKLSAREMRQRMAAMRDVDGTLFFCWAKRGTRIAPSDKTTRCSMCDENDCECNGALLTVGQVQAFINTETQKRKKCGT